MGKFLKKFQTHEEYEEYIETGDTVTPCVSRCVEENDVHYKGHFIWFADPAVKAICVAQWGGATGGSTGVPGKDGELTYKQAAAVKTWLTAYDNPTFYNRTDLTTFDEFQYFTGLTPRGGYFQGCNFDSITLPNIPNAMNTDNVFRGSTIGSLHIPSNVKTFGKNCCISATFQKVYIDSVESWMNATFYNATDSNPICKTSHIYVNGVETTSFTIPEGTTSIGVHFASPTVTAISLPSTLTTIGSFAFRYTKITELTIPSGVTSIGTYAMANCTNLTSLEFPSGVTSISEYVCSGDIALTSVTFNGTLTSIGRSSFSGCTSLTSVAISGVSNLTTGYASFGSCSNLQTMTFPEGTKTIGDRTFINCPKLVTVNIPSTVTTIGTYCFTNDGLLANITIPSGLTTLGGGAFQNCRAIHQLVIPSGVTTIGNETFKGCTTMQSITFEGTTPPTLANAGAFSNSNNCPIYVPAESVDTYKGATNWSSVASRIQAIPTS